MAPHDASLPPDQAALERTLKKRLAQAGFVLAFERAWPFVVLSLSIASLFLTWAWLGLFDLLPNLPRLLAAFVVILAGVFPLLLAFRSGRARLQESVARLDRDSGLAHHPLATALDQPVAPSTDPLTDALWRANQNAAFAQIVAIRVKAPDPQLARKDPYALRFAFPLAALAAFFVAGSEQDARLAGVFNWDDTALAAQSARLDAWIDPPAYTHLPPVLIDLKANGTPRLKPFSVPVGSTVILRSSDPTNVTATPSSGLERNADLASTTVPEWRWTLKATSQLVIRVGNHPLPALAFDAVPDLPPHIELTTPPVSSETSLTLAYRAGDDYGLASGELRVSRPRAGAHDLLGKHPPLVEAPRLSILLPIDRRDGTAKTKIEPSESPWAGTNVDLTLTVKDDAGQEASTSPVPLRLPQRLFTNGIARALVEQRRRMALAPDRWHDVDAALNALLIAPDRFLPDAGVYLGLRAVERELASARSDADLLQSVDSLWKLAVSIEEHEQGDEKKALDAAREALKKALENGASPDEIKALTDRLKSALDAYLKSYAAKAQKNQKAAGENRQSSGKSFRPEDLQAMVDQMNELAKRGAADDAARMLEALNAILDQLQTSEPQLADPSSQEMNNALGELDKMMREQRSLRDDTFRQGKGNSGSPKGDSKSLAERQNALRNKLDGLLDQMKELGVPDEGALGEADEAMKNAEGAIGEGDNQGALGEQGKAIESLKKGAQALAKSLDGNAPGNGPGKRPGGQNQQGNGSGAGDDKDPLGRSARQPDSGEGALHQGGKGGSLEKRSREVVEELRKRLGDPSRAPDELNYLRRLLERN
jgi:uncharacterized protein (TIGR02302 family)